MSKIWINEQTLHNIADAVREKRGTSDTYKPGEMPVAISGIISLDDENAIFETLIGGGSGPINLPNISYIGARFGYGNTLLTTITASNASAIGTSAFYGCTSLTNVSFPACIQISAYAFYGCTSLTNASFPACTQIETHAFHGCSNLTNASFPACTQIGISAFLSCSNLTNASFPACTQIGSSAFLSCNSLSYVYIPSCRTIRNNAFAGCTSLQSVYLLGPSVCELTHKNAFTNTPISNASGSIYVIPELVDAYKSAANWSDYASRITAYVGDI